MKTLLIVIILYISAFQAISQELKVKKVKQKLFNEDFQIEKKTKQMNGYYLKLNPKSGDTLVSGQYKNNIQAGTWIYYNQSRRPIIKYNFDKDSCIWISEEVNLRDSFLIKSYKKFVLALPQRSPVFLGFKGELEQLLADEIETPFSIVQSWSQKQFLYSFTVDKTGRIAEVADVESDDKKTNATVHQILAKPELRWLPAILNNYPFETKFYLSVNMQPVGTEPQEPAKPFIICVNVRYAGVIKPTTNPKRSIGYQVIDIPANELKFRK